MQFLRAEEIEKMRVIATVLLFGCSSIKLLPAGGRLPGYGVSNQYLMGCRLVQKYLLSVSLIE